ncbi:MAG: hypothetical protein RLZZ175_3335 [Bacteroidota bacterium]|jgi:hypothetical protein
MTNTLNWIKTHYTLSCTILITLIYPLVYFIGYQLNYFESNGVFVMLFLQAISSLLAVQFNSFLQLKTVLANEQN